MADDPLYEILHLEEELRRRLADEEERLLARRQALQQELETGEQALQQELELERQRALERARAAAEAEAEALLEAARQYAATLDGFDDGELRAVLRRHLPLLLTGENHDHPHGQG